MHDWVEKLISLQEKDLRILMLQEQIDSAPAEKARVSDMLSSAQEGVAAARAVVQEHEKALKTFEMDVQEVEQRMRDFQSKSMMIKDNQEYKAALLQIEEYREHISKIEDKELAVMELIEEARGLLGLKQKELKEAQDRIGEMQADLDTRVTVSTAELEKVAQQRADVRASLDSSIVSRYERLMRVPARGRPDRRVFVPIRDNVCDRCHMNVTAQLRNDARKGGCVTCPHCSGMVYWED